MIIEGAAVVRIPSLRYHLSCFPIVVKTDLNKSDLGRPETTCDEQSVPASNAEAVF
jgi:hypothetical protein